MNYQETQLWNKSLGNEEAYGHCDLRNDLISAFISARENASYVLSKIRNDFPNLTVHDIPHVDGLWQIASVIIGDTYPITPLEGFILGCSFLMHDAVLSYEVAGGVDNLRSQIEWKDYYEDCKNDNSLSNTEALFEADFRTIRLIHANKAEGLHHQLFEKEDGSSFYIIDNQRLRDHYGEIICKIAGSHHWDIEKVAKLDTQMPATSEYPQEWRINPLKLACILRCADAGHIDDGRAPDYLLGLLKVNNVSRNHWIAQNRLSQIDVDNNDSEKVIIKSNISFREEDFAAWNVAYDAVQVLDHELKISNELLKRRCVDLFRIRGVSGAGSREELSKYIKTDGWEPYDACVHISNVEGLIKNLGGEKLYGKDHKLEIVLRELIQNSRDAIVARRNVDFDYDGGIHVAIDKEDDGTWISIADDGVGMSVPMIKDYFLNFGCSFWSSDLAKQEFSGLNSSGFKSVGQFGIGFYSIFMVAAKVVVESRKYDSALDDNLVIKFPTGLSLRPVVSHNRGISSVSTVVRFLLDPEKEKWSNRYSVRPSLAGALPFEVPYSSIIAHITAGIDVDVYYRELGYDEIRVHHNINEIEEGSNEIAEWMKDISYARFRNDIRYSNYIDSNYKRLKRITVDGVFYGIAALNTFWDSQASFFDVSTVGGLANAGGGTNNGDYIGCLISEAITAKRDTDEGSIDRTQWAKEQVDLLCEKELSESDKLYLPYVVGKYGIDMTDVMNISFMDNHYANKRTVFCGLKDLIKRISVEKKRLMIGLSSLGNTNRAENYLDIYRASQQLGNEEVLFVPVKNSAFLSIEENDSAFPMNLLWCINKVCNDLGIKYTKTIEYNKVPSHFDGNCSAMIFVFLCNINNRWLVNMFCR